MQIAQVHRVTLIDGQKVVVKVQHEDNKKSHGRFGNSLEFGF